MAEVHIQALVAAIRHLQGCEPTWVESVAVTETFEGETVWQGEVQVFDLQGHPTAKRAYGWSHAVDNSDRRRFVAVLHEGPINSPQAAVRAAIRSSSGGDMRPGRAYSDGSQREWGRRAIGACSESLCPSGL
jgi:hypothetical protein